MTSEWHVRDEGKRGHAADAADAVVAVVAADAADAVGVANKPIEREYICCSVKPNGCM